MTESIHPDTTIGAVALAVADLGRSLAYYQEVIGLRLHRQEAGTAYLGVGGPDLLILTEKPGARAVRGTSGLYHFAILTPSRLDLAKSLRRLAETGTRIGGFADHAVSEAIYLSDPDGNGIEIYRDRPREAWPYRDGQLQMTTEALDVEGVLAELEGKAWSWNGLHPDTTIGHIHLHVGDLEAAEAFYTQVLGFDLITRYGPSAGFVSAGGYHHHIGFNTWAGVGAPLPPADAAGLRWYEIRLPNAAEVEKVVGRVRQAGLPVDEQGDGFLARDPAENGIVLTSRRQQGK